jgi:hypothetical protein
MDIPQEVVFLLGTLGFSLPHGKLYFVAATLHVGRGAA